MSMHNFRHFMMLIISDYFLFIFTKYQIIFNYFESYQICLYHVIKKKIIIILTFSNFLRQLVF